MYQVFKFWELHVLCSIAYTIIIVTAATHCTGRGQVECLREACDEQLDKDHSVSVQLLGGAGRDSATNTSLPGTNVRGQ